MPGFVKTPKDEARWSKAKEAAKKSKAKDEASFQDQDWALVNHIYHQMGKAEDLGKAIRDFFDASRTSTDASSLEELKSFLEKARRRMSDEAADPDEEGPESLEEHGFRETDPDFEEDQASKWLEQNDPEGVENENGPEDEDDFYNEYGPDEDEESHQRDEGQVEEPAAEMQAPGKAGGAEGDPTQVQGPQEEGQEVTQVPMAADDKPESATNWKWKHTTGTGKHHAKALASDEDIESRQHLREQGVGPFGSSASSKGQPTPAREGGGRFPQPSREEIADMRQYTRPWEQRAREKQRLEAEAHVNPVLHHEGKMVEARNAAHKSHQDAYGKMQSSPEYQNADPVSQMEMDSKFDEDWHKQNPEYLANAAKLHGEAHKKGLAAKDVHAAAKDEQIRHILSGGAQAETPMSVEEGMQHAGGAKGEEGTTGSMTQDPSSSFAHGNREFLEQYAKDYAKKGKKPKSMEDMMNYDEGSKADVARVLGDHPALKDPGKKAKVDQFFEKYHPLIGMSAHKVLNKLGIDHKRGDIDLGMLHEAGMHGLMQAINDYEHGHHSQASFSTHAGNKIRGLQQTAMRNQDAIPHEMRVGAKKFQAGQATPVAKPDLNSLMAKHPPEVADRMKRIGAFKQIHAPKVPKPGGGNENG